MTEQQLKEATEKSAKLEKELAEHKTNSTNEIEKLKGEKTALNAQLTDVQKKEKEKYDALNTELSQLKTKTNEEIAKLKQENATLTQQLAKEKEQSNNSKTELSQLTTKTNEEIGKLKEEKTALTEQLSQSQIEINKHKQEIISLKEALQKSEAEKSYTINNITEKNEIKLKDDINGINKGIDFDDYGNVFNTHDKIINEWNENTTKLQHIKSEIAKSNKITMNNNPEPKNDDNKQSDNDKDQKDKPEIVKAADVQSCNELLSSYIACNKLIDQQSKRLHQITTNSHIMQLFKNKNGLLAQLNSNRTKTTAKSQENDDANKNYTSTKDKRTSLIKTIDATVIECNETIERENGLLDKIQQATNVLNLLDKQQKQLSSLSDKCQSLIDGYQSFEQANNECIDSINTHFNKEWKAFESMWYKWKIIDIISWFKYKTFKINASSVDWENVQNQMTKRNIKGASLQNFENATLDLIGIVDFNIAVFLMKRITTLINRYPIKYVDSDDNDNDDGKDDEDGNCKIPKKFICPLTNEIMKDPVMAFDLNIYEREAIEKYLKEKGKSPITNEEASTLTVFAQKQLKLEIQTYRVLTNMDNEEGITSTATTTSSGENDGMVEID